MKVIAAGKAKNGFGFLMDTARFEPVTIARHGRPVAVVLSVTEFERLKGKAGELVNDSTAGSAAPMSEAP